jgi:hypothetical protein
MTVKFFSQYFMTSVNDIGYYGEGSRELLRLKNYEWNNSLKIMKLPVIYIFVGGFEKFGGMVGGLV